MIYIWCCFLLRGAVSHAFQHARARTARSGNQVSSPLERMLELFMQDVQSVSNYLSTELYVYSSSCAAFSVHWELISPLLQVTGTCDNTCYVLTGEERHLLTHNERLVDPNDKCSEYICDVSYSICKLRVLTNCSSLVMYVL